MLADKDDDDLMRSCKLGINADVFKLAVANLINIYKFKKKCPITIPLNHILFELACMSTSVFFRIFVFRISLGRHVVIFCVH